jgi:hypothetical protein
MPTTELKDYSIDDISKALGSAAIVAYILGFVVLSYYFSQFGFNQISPFRPRVLETGISTLIFYIIPILIGVTVAHIPNRDISPLLILGLRFCFLVILCYFIATYPGIVKEFPRSVSPDHPLGLRIIAEILLALVALALVMSAGIMGIKWVWNNFHDAPKRSILILASIATLCCALEIIPPRSSDFSLRIFIWFVVLATTSCQWIGPRRDRSDRSRREINKLSEEKLAEEYRLLLLETSSDTSLMKLKTSLNLYLPIPLLGAMMFSILVYTNWIYPLIPFKLGGGQIVQIALYETSPTQAPQVIRCGMLDQSDQGYFVLLAGQEKATFIPKERVEEIHFSQDTNEVMGAGGISQTNH